MDGFRRAAGFAGLFDIVNPIKSRARLRTSTFASVFVIRDDIYAINVIYALPQARRRDGCASQRHLCKMNKIAKGRERWAFGQ
jgi:hypothetical protein